MPKSQSTVQPTLVGAIAATSRPEDDSNTLLDHPPVRLGLAQQLRIQEDIPMPELPPMPTSMEVDGDDVVDEKKVQPQHIPTPTIITVETPPKDKKEDGGGTSPRPGPSREAGDNEVYFKKTRHYYQKAEKEQLQLENSRKMAQVEDEPQDLSANASNVAANSNKMDIDEMSDSSDSAEIFRNDNSNSRPPIIITRKKLSDAIQYATTTVLAKSKTNSLAECERQKVVDGGNDFELPSDFFDLSDDESSSSANKTAKIVNGTSATSGNSNSSSPGKSVIVRAGPSVSACFCFYFSGCG